MSKGRAGINGVLLLLPFLLLLLISLDSLLRGQPGAWHERCVEFWNQKKWQEIRALTDNLYQIGLSDAETLSFAMLASEQLRNPDDIALFANRWLESRPLNLRMEIQTARLFQPESLAKRITLFRTRILLGLFAILSLLYLLSLPGRYDFLPLISILSTFGCLLLIL